MPARFRIEAPRAASLVLAEAVLVYREAQHNAIHAYASIHRVEIGEGRPVILAGKPMSPRAARRLARELAQQAPASASFLDGRTLYVGDTLRVWWVPAGVRHIAFRCTELGERGEAVPHPALVFAVSAKGWWVWACKDNVRPTPETPLCRAPYFNVSDLGAICLGSTVVPTGDASSRIDAWTEAFFGSFFSHPNGTKLVKYKHGANAFWKSMLDAPPVRFPVRALMPMEKTLANMIAHIGGEHD
jgi:PRTRC genetic system protein B